MNWIKTLCRYFKVSAMDKKAALGSLVGRPFRAVAILCKKSLSKYITLIESDADDGRFISVKLRVGSKNFCITCVYFPCVYSVVEYVINTSSIFAHIENVLLL
jgi:hypothetical protein